MVGEVSLSHPLLFVVHNVPGKNIQVYRVGEVSLSPILSFL